MVRYTILNARTALRSLRRNAVLYLAIGMTTAAMYYPAAGYYRICKDYSAIRHKNAAVLEDRLSLGDTESAASLLERKDEFKLLWRDRKRLGRELDRTAGMQGFEHHLKQENYDAAYGLLKQLDEKCLLSAEERHGLEKRIEKLKSGQDPNRPASQGYSTGTGWTAYEVKSW